MPENRKLTDADVKAIVTELQASMNNSFYNDIGKGFFGIMKKLLWMGALALAAYGASKGIESK